MEQHNCNFVGEETALLIKKQFKALNPSAHNFELITNWEEKGIGEVVLFSVFLIGVKVYVEYVVTAQDFCVYNPQ